MRTVLSPAMRKVHQRELFGGLWVDISVKTLTQRRRHSRRACFPDQGKGGPPRGAAGTPWRLGRSCHPTQLALQRRSPARAGRDGAVARPPARGGAAHGVPRRCRRRGGRSRCRTLAFAGLSREARRKREGIPGSTGLGVPDARAWAGR